MPWPSSAVNSGPRRLSQAHAITETCRNSQPTCSAASCSSPADRPDVQSSPKILFRYSGAPGRSCLTPRVGGQDRGASYDVESARETAVGKAASSLHKPPTGRSPSSLGPVAGHPHFDPVRGAGRRVRELVLLQFHYRVVVAHLGQGHLRLLLRFGPYIGAAPVWQDARGGAVRRTIENPITVIAALRACLSEEFQ